MKWLCLVLLSLPHLFAVLNPYKVNLELLLQEPSSGAYSKKDAISVEELWLPQKVDHFDALNNQTWQMRYYRNGKYHRNRGPIFIFVGGEWSISPGFLVTGLTHDMAVENAGMLFYTEHRYYGPSLPHGEQSFQLDQLQHLSIYQSLADLAHFIRFQKKENPRLRQSKVILVGGSYSGSMVAWMTQLYPDLIAASWASSAPLLAKADFYEYMEVVSHSIRLSYGQNCSTRIQKGFHHLAKLFDENHILELLQKLNSCEDYEPNDPLDRAAFFNGLGNYFALIVQSYSSNIPQLCETLLSLNANDEEAFEGFLELLFAEGKRSSDCQDFSYKAMLQLFSDPISGIRAWFHQTCNEFGWYTTTERINKSSTSSSAPTFANQVPLSYYERLCLDAFGPEQTPERLALGIEQTNNHFGGFQFNQSERYAEVFFTHGQLDPWRSLGKQKGNQAIVLRGYSHCEDLGGIQVRDSVQMNLAKLRVMSFLRRHI
ncbi:blast:Putative serine protease K12H4.7 [Drosophila guanche]|uniref:Blast:Putative serine protease K12H4.7 n=2 Tax=Drosophila guanche TaxID=7266 RepID=A0A3B0JNF1_DROGU|nr:blast:Putative serine protease K12H4.7 [Drosophila guanche]